MDHLQSLARRSAERSDDARPEHDPPQRTTDRRDKRAGFAPDPPGLPVPFATGRSPSTATIPHLQSSNQKPVSTPPSSFTSFSESPNEATTHRCQEESPTNDQFHGIDRLVACIIQIEGRGG